MPGEEKTIKEKEDEKKKARVVKVKVNSKKGKKKKSKDSKRIAIIRVRGKVHIRRGIEDTLKLLHLSRVNHCSVIDTREEFKGMIYKINDYVTWGEISPEVFEKLIEKRGLLKGNKKLTEDYIIKNSKFKSIKEFSSSFMNFSSELKDAGLKPVFRLNPPRGGYDRKGIKKPYTKGGVLGYRKEKINELIEHML